MRKCPACGKAVPKGLLLAHAAIDCKGGKRRRKKSGSVYAVSGGLPSLGKKR